MVAMLPLPPKPVSLMILFLSALMALSGVLGLVLSVYGNRYLSLGFEATLILAGVFGVLAGLGRFRDGPGLAALCVGGTIFVCGVLSEPTLVPRLLGRGGAPSVVMGVDLVHLAMARVATGLLVTALAGAIVLLRRPRESLSMLARGVVIGLPLVLAGILAMTPSVRGFVTGLQPVFIVVLVCAVLLVLGACLSISIHCIIRSFELGREESL